MDEEEATALRDLVEERRDSVEIVQQLGRERRSRTTLDDPSRRKRHEPAVGAPGRARWIPASHASSSDRALAGLERIEAEGRLQRDDGHVDPVVIERGQALRADRVPRGRAGSALRRGRGCRPPGTAPSSAREAPRRTTRARGAGARRLVIEARSEPAGADDGHERLQLGERLALVEKRRERADERVGLRRAATERASRGGRTPARRAGARSRRRALRARPSPRAAARRAGPSSSDPRSPPPASSRRARARREARADAPRPRTPGSRSRARSTRSRPSPERAPRPSGRPVSGAWRSFTARSAALVSTGASASRARSSAVASGRISNAAAETRRPSGVTTRIRLRGIELDLELSLDEREGVARRAVHLREGAKGERILQVAVRTLAALEQRREACERRSEPGVGPQLRRSPGRGSPRLRRTPRDRARRRRPARREGGGRRRRQARPRPSRTRSG